MTNGARERPEPTTEVTMIDEAGSPRSGGDLLELVLQAEQERHEAEKPARIDGIVIGRLRAVLSSSDVRVEIPGHASADGVVARSMAGIREDAIGRHVALMFEQGDPERPVVLGLIHGELGGELGRPPENESDGQRLELSADKEIVLRCGKASITLTRAGKILIRGAYVSTRASGVNRIQGGSVQIN